MKTLKFLKNINEKFTVKIFVIFTTFIFIISTTFILFSIRQQNKYLTRALIKEGKILAKLLAHNTKLGIFSENEKLLKIPVEGILEQEGVLNVSIFNLEGSLLKRQRKKGIKIQKEGLSRERRDFNEIFARLKVSRSPFYIQNKDQLEFWAPVTSDSGYSTDESLFFTEQHLWAKDRVIGFVKINIDTKRLSKRLKAQLLNSIPIGIIFLLLGSVITYCIAKGITRPLNKLTKGVKALETGSSVEKVSVETTDEIGKLALAFNNMSESLKRREAEKAQLEEQLRHTQKMEAIGTLAGGIAHDFNNILHIITGFAEMTLDYVSKESLAQGNLKQILKAANRAKNLIHHILSFSQKNKSELLPVKIQDIVKETLELLRASLPSTIEIRQTIETDTGIVLADSTQIHQVLMNLCTNASHAMQGETMILEVSLRDIDFNMNTAAQYSGVVPGAYVMLTVSDTGHGIAPEIIDRIFEPYFTTKEVNKGTGMGLAVVHGIIQRHGGIITVKSELGKGTTFDILLPKTKRNITSNPMTPAPKLTGNKCVLFIDDEEAIVDMGKQMLKRLGYDIIARASSVEAMQVFKAQPDKFDLVITDQTMPNMTGELLAQELLRLRPDIPIILCTGHSDLIREEKAIRAGIKAFLRKPLMIQDLAKTIQDVLQ